MNDDARANREHRRDVAVAVLEAIDVDQYLIDAVRAAVYDCPHPDCPPGLCEDES